MRGLACIAAAVGGLSSIGCTTVDKYSGLDGPPGGYVSGTSSFQRAASSLNPVSDYNSQWTLVRVIAPPGATRCRIADQSMFVPDGPKTEGAPDAKREVMLTYDADATSAAFECKTPAGVVKRTVKAVPYNWPRPEQARFTIDMTTQVKPPLVHIDPADPYAKQRWADLAIELCPNGSARASAFVCKPGMFEKLKAEDIGG